MPIIIDDDSPSTLAKLRTELIARGFDALGTSRANMVINQAIAEVDASAPWPYLEASAVGGAPLSINDLGRVDFVVNQSTNTRLEPVAFSNLLDWDGDLSRVGTPEAYYVAWPSGSPVVGTYPSNGDTIGVQYWMVSPELVADGDEPLAPVRFYSAYLAVACRIASNDSEGDAARWQAEADRWLGLMGEALLSDRVAGTYQRISGASEDW